MFNLFNNRQTVGVGVLTPKMGARLKIHRGWGLPSLTVQQKVVSEQQIWSEIKCKTIILLLSQHLPAIPYDQKKEDNGKSVPKWKNKNFKIMLLIL